MNPRTSDTSDPFNKYEASIQAFLEASRQTQPKPLDRDAVRASLPLPVVGAGELPSATQLIFTRHPSDVLEAPGPIHVWTPVRPVYDANGDEASFYAGLGSILIGGVGPGMLWMSAFAPAKLEQMANLLPFIG